MTNEEKQQNALLIIKVPLIQKEIHKKSLMPSYNSMMFEVDDCLPSSSIVNFFNESKSEKADVEDAIISVGEVEGVFREIGNLEIQRDERYPVRVTLQYYKATSNGVVDEDVMAQVYQQIVDARSFGTNVGSLVVGGDTGRPTEFIKKYGGYTLPTWWNEFWLMYGNTFSHYTKEEAADKVFVNGRYCQSTLSESKSRILSILGNSNPLRKPTTWRLFD